MIQGWSCVASKTKRVVQKKCRVRLRCYFHIQYVHIIYLRYMCKNFLKRNMEYTLKLRAFRTVGMFQLMRCSFRVRTTCARLFGDGICGRQGFVRLAFLAYLYLHVWFCVQNSSKAYRPVGVFSFPNTYLTLNPSGLSLEKAFINPVPSATFIDRSAFFWRSHYGVVFWRTTTGVDNDPRGDLRSGRADRLVRRLPLPYTAGIQHGLSIDQRTARR